jgi:hypothetical protein
MRCPGYKKGHGVASWERPYKILECRDGRIDQDVDERGVESFSVVGWR